MLLCKYTWTVSTTCCKCLSLLCKTDEQMNNAVPFTAVLAQTGYYKGKTTMSR